MSGRTAEDNSVRAVGRLLSDPQLARVRTIRAAEIRCERATPDALQALPVELRPAATEAGFGSHPWGEVLDSVFRPGTKQHRAADRLLDLRQATREELARWSNLSGSSISNLINTMTRAGFVINRWTGHDRRAHFHVLRHHTSGSVQAGEEDPAHVPDAVATASPSDPRIALIPDRTGARVRYLGHREGLAFVEIEGQGQLPGRFLGPVIPVSLLNGVATLHRMTLDRGAIDLEIGDRLHRTRLRLDLRDVRLNT
jgi:hypothetical protein